MTQQRNTSGDHVEIAAKGIGAGLLAIMVAVCRQCDDVARIGFHCADDVGRGALSQVDDVGRNAFSSGDALLRSADDLMPESKLRESAGRILTESRSSRLSTRSRMRACMSRTRLFTRVSSAPQRP